TLLPYTTLFRSTRIAAIERAGRTRTGRCCRSTPSSGFLRSDDREVEMLQFRGHRAESGRRAVRKHVHHQRARHVTRQDQVVLQPDLAEFAVGDFLAPYLARKLGRELVR